MVARGDGTRSPSGHTLSRAGSLGARRGRRGSFSAPIPFEPASAVAIAAATNERLGGGGGGSSSGGSGANGRSGSVGQSPDGGLLQTATAAIEDVDESGAVERALRASSDRHLQRHLRQLLAAQGLDHERWCPVVLSLVRKVQGSVQPNVRTGDSMDIRHYVKIRCLTGGELSDCSYHQGVVFTKNVA